MEDHYETLIRDEIVALTKALVASPLGDSLKDAQLKGKISAMNKALELYRKASRIDIEQELRD